MFLICQLTSEDIKQHHLPTSSFPRCLLHLPFASGCAEISMGGCTDGYYGHKSPQAVCLRRSLVRRSLDWCRHSVLTGALSRSQHCASSSHRAKFCWVQCCFTSTETSELLGNTGPHTSTFTQLLSSPCVRFSVALRPQRPQGLLGTGSPGRTLRLSHIS